LVNYSPAQRADGWRSARPAVVVAHASVACAAVPSPDAYPSVLQPECYRRPVVAMSNGSVSFSRAADGESVPFLFSRLTNELEVASPSNIPRLPIFRWLNSQVPEESRGECRYRDQVDAV